MKQAGTKFSIFARIVSSIFILTSAINCWADPVLPSLFSDHMVLQQGRKIHIWGKADAGEKIAVIFGGGTAATNAGPDASSGKRTLRVATSTKKAAESGHKGQRRSAAQPISARSSRRSASTSTRSLSTFP